MQKCFALTNRKLDRIIVVGQNQRHSSFLLELREMVASIKDLVLSKDFEFNIFRSALSQMPHSFYVREMGDCNKFIGFSFPLNDDCAQILTISKNSWRKKECTYRESGKNC